MSETLTSADAAAPLPPGQRELGRFPRYGLFQFATRIQTAAPPLQLDIAGDVREPLTLAADSLAGLPRIEQTRDFHCITTWSRRGLHWSGFRFRDFYEQIVLPRCGPAADIRYVVFRAGDGYCSYLLLEDVLAADVMLADQHQHLPLSWQHGAPLRLLAPAHYGFKSVKHLQRIEFCARLDDYRSPTLHWTEHARGRVAYEERGRLLPTWFYRYLFRAVIPLVLWWFDRAERRHRAPR